jgi:hypothetical protein
MTDEATISSPPDDSGLVAFADCELVGINNSMMLVINRSNGRQQIMSPQVVEGLKTCTEFRTVAQHATNLAATRPELQGQLEMATNALQNVSQAGMLQKAGEVSVRLAVTVSPELAPTRAFIITCDRPTAVTRLLDSMLQAGNLSRHDALFLVDDSREEANRAANREAVVSFNLRSAKDMFYVGREAQDELLAALLDSLPEHAAGIRFLLDPDHWEGKKTYGRSRTLCQLLSVGYRAIMMDDDVLCRAIHAPLRDDGIGIGSGGLRKAAFFANEQELLASGQSTDFDPLSGHATLLGSTLSHSLQALNQGPLQAAQLAGVSAALANVLQADSPVLVTQCGSLGDPGAGSPHWAQYLGEDSIQRLVSAPHGMTAALENRLTWLGSSRPNIFKMPFMSQVTGLDNTHLLPPYFPAFRGEDSLFGAMLVAMHPLSVALEYPWSVPHLPIEPRPLDLNKPVGSGGGIDLFARYLTGQIDYRDALQPAQRLSLLAEDARRLAARADSDLLLDYRSALAAAHAEQLYILQGRYAHAQRLNAPDWQAYLERRIAEMQQALTTPQSPCAISGLPDGVTEPEVLSEFRGLAQGFAAALSGWVQMRAIASGVADTMISSRSIVPF